MNDAARLTARYVLPWTLRGVGLLLVITGFLFWVGVPMVLLSYWLRPGKPVQPARYPGRMVVERAGE